MGSTRYHIAGVSDIFIPDAPSGVPLAFNTFWVSGNNGPGFIPLFGASPGWFNGTPPAVGDKVLVVFLMDPTTGLTGGILAITGSPNPVSISDTIVLDAPNPALVQLDATDFSALAFIVITYRPSP